MANAAAFIQESIWRDEHWRQLSRSAQALYMQLLSQKELDCAGILPLQVNKWAKGCDALTVDQVWADLAELQRERFVFYDIDTDEALVRTYMRNSNVIKSPNMRRSASRSALLVGSAFIKLILAAELCATGDAECIAAADQINPSGTPPEPFPNSSTRTVSEPLPEGSGVGVGVGEPHPPDNSTSEKELAPKKSPQPTKAKPRTRIPNDYRPEPHIGEKIHEEFPSLPNHTLREVHEDFCLYWKGQGRPMADWDATWLRWMRKELPKFTVGRNNGSNVTAFDRKKANNAAVYASFADPVPEVLELS